MDYRYQPEECSQLSGQIRLDRTDLRVSSEFEQLSSGVIQFAPLT